MSGAEDASLWAAPHTPERQRARLVAIAGVVLADTSRLHQSTWHCGTAHCLAGWAEELAGPELARAALADFALLPLDDPSWENAAETERIGLVLLGQEAWEMFFKWNEAVVDWLRDIAEEGATA